MMEGAANNPVWKYELPADKIKRAHVQIDKAIAKRNYAKKLWDESEEELIEAQIILREAENAGKVRKH